MSATSGSSLRWWLLAAAASAVAAVASLLLLTKPPPVPRVVLAVDAGARCPDEALLPSPVRADSTAALALTGDDAVRFSLDGEATFSPLEAPHRFAAGEHRLRVEARGAAPSELRLELAPFRPAIVDARIDGPAVTAVLLGATCTSCPPSQGDVQLSHDPSAGAADLDASARALAAGDWRAALPSLRALAPSALTPRARRQRASVYSLAGLPTAARTAVERTAELRPLAAAFDRLAHEEARHEGDVTRRRWNTLTERYHRLADRFGSDAPGPAGAATARFDKLSAAFLKAAEERDAIAQDALVEAGETSVRELVSALRSLRLSDCAWQARITAAL